MEQTPHYHQYLQILQEELLPAMGCTEPISIALAAAKARDLLADTPSGIELEVSGNIIKNAKSVTVPNTGGLKGMEAAVAAGIVVGQSEMELEVISKIAPEKTKDIADFLQRCPIKVIPSKRDKVFFIGVTLRSEKHSAVCQIADHHTNVILLSKDGEVLFQRTDSVEQTEVDRSLLSVDEIIRFADCVDVEDLRPTVERQIRYNAAISQEGLSGKWGAAVGQTILHIQGKDNVAARATAAAAAGSDARMSGCELPVIIVSGSGNQGMTASLPVLEYAKSLGASEEETLRAVALSDLITIHQKSSIGRLSAFCGAVSAGCGAAAGIAYLNGGRYDVIAHTVANTLAICSGMICDGAKPSCAAKIAAAVNAGLTGYYMYMNGGHQFLNGQGIVKDSVESTIVSVGRLARDGMRQTDEEILEIMVGH